MTPDQEMALFAKIRDQVEQVVNVYRAARPDLKILVSGYDFGRFDSTAKWHYKTIYEHMNKPTPLEQNSGFIRFSKVMTSLATTDGMVAYVQHFGVSHYWYGISEEHVRRKTTAAPALISPPGDMNATGGLPQYKDDAMAMLRIDGIYVDPMHLSPSGFRHLFEHSIEQYLGKWVKEMN